MVRALDTLRIGRPRAPSTVSPTVKVQVGVAAGQSVVSVTCAAGVESSSRAMEVSPGTLIMSVRVVTVDKSRPVPAHTKVV